MSDIVERIEKADVDLMWRDAVEEIRQLRAEIKQLSAERDELFLENGKLANDLTTECLRLRDEALAWEAQSQQNRDEVDRLRALVRRLLNAWPECPELIHREARCELERAALEAKTTPGYEMLADTIVRRDAEIVRLRAALQDALTLCGVWDDNHPIKQRARRALEGGKS